jgi:hypothetical protein
MPTLLESDPRSRAEHYESLAAVKHEAFGLLTRGAVDRRSAFHTPVFVTYGLENFPSARTVVLRGFDPVRRVIAFHSDRRSRKIAELMVTDAGAAVFYDAKIKIQVRVRGRCRVHSGDEVALEAWQRLPAFSRRCYLGEAPGTPSGHPTSGLAEEYESNTPTEDQTKTAFGDFAVIRLHVNELEWLYLSAHGHRRARLSWLKTNFEQAEWLTP